MTTENLMEILHSGGYSLVVWNGGTHTFIGRGVADLYEFYTQQRALLHSALIADKVIGKGAASLMALGGVKEVATDVISASALSLLKEAGIPVSFRNVVPNIINRKGDGICPVEQLCKDCTTPEECMPHIERFMSDKN